MRRREIPMSFFAQKAEDGRVHFVCASKPTKIKRLTKGSDYEVFGGNELSHKMMVKFVEGVSRRMRSLAEKTGDDHLEKDAFGEIVRESAIESFGFVSVKERGT
jgi:hypothetical protein